MLLDNLRLVAVNRHRKRLFGESSLKVYTTTPEAGEVSAAEFPKDWFGQRLAGTTDGGTEAGSWQFQIAAAADWPTSQTFMNSIVAVTIGTRRWKVKKVEKPIGTSFMWKVRAEIQ